MIPLKWKFYRVINYLLLCCGIIFFLSFLRLIINATDRRFQNFSLLVSLIFLFMASQSLINIIIMSKTFPDKIPGPNKARWHVFSLVLNLISSIGLLVCWFTIVSDMGDHYLSGLLVTFAVISILMLLSIFVFICQINLRKYLRQKNESLMNSLIASIGENTENSE